MVVVLIVVVSLVLLLTYSLCRAAGEADETFGGYK